MHSGKHCSVALLRPVETEGIEFLLGEESTLSPSERVRGQQLDMLVDETRLLIDDAAERTGIRTCTTEYQLHSRNGKTQVMSRKRSANVREHDLVVGIDPTPEELGFLCGVIDRYPLQRGLIFFTEQGTREALLHLLGSKRIPVFLTSPNGVSFRKIPKLFSGHLPLNEDAAARRHQENVAATELALRFPDIPLQEATRDQFMRLFLANN